MCTSGSAIFSTMPRSISVPSPLVSTLDEFAGAAREVAHHARHLLEHPAHRHHAHARADALQIVGDLGHLADVAAQARGDAAAELGGVGDHRFDDDQLADERDEAVDPLQVDFDEFGEFGGRPRLLGAHRLGDLLGGGRALGHRLFAQPPAAVRLRLQRRGDRLRGDLVDLAQDLADRVPGCGRRQGFLVALPGDARLQPRDEPRQVGLARGLEAAAHGLAQVPRACAARAPWCRTGGRSRRP